MAKRKVQQQYGPKITTPKMEAGFQSLVQPDDFNDKYEACVVIDDTPECKAMLKVLKDFQDQNLKKDGRDPVDRLLCAKPEKAKDEKTGKWTAETGRELLFFKQANRDKFSIVGPDKRPVEASVISKGDTIRVNGQCAFGYMKGDPYLTLYLNAVQWVSGGGASGVDAFDDESDGSEAPFETQEDPTAGFDDEDLDLE